MVYSPSLVSDGTLSNIDLFTIVDLRMTSADTNLASVDVYRKTHRRHAIRCGQAKSSEEPRIGIRSTIPGDLTIEDKDPDKCEQEPRERMPRSSGSRQRFHC